MTDRRRRILRNKDEFDTEAALREAVTETGHRLDAKVRVADAVDIEHSRLSNGLYGYAMRAHFDWLVSDTTSTLPEFAVEFDGASHRAEETKARDVMKDEICRRMGLPLLRVDRLALRPFRQWTVLAALVEAWAQYKAFNAAQDSGTIPNDEWFDAALTLTVDPATGRVEQPYHLSAWVHRLMERMVDQGQLLEWRHAQLGSYTGRDDSIAFAWAYLPDGSVVAGEARVRAYDFPALPDYELAPHLALINLGDRLEMYLEGDRSVVTTEAALLDRLPVPDQLIRRESRFDPREFGGWSFGQMTG